MSTRADLEAQIRSQEQLIKTLRFLILCLDCGALSTELP